MNKHEYIEALVKATGYDEEKCIVINSIIEESNLIGRNNKDKIKVDFMEKLNLTDEEADKLYNTCMELIVKGIFRKD